MHVRQHGWSTALMIRGIGTMMDKLDAFFAPYQTNFEDNGCELQPGCTAEAGKVVLVGVGWQLARPSG